MRRLILASSFVLVSACASRPQPLAPPVQQPAPPPQVQGPIIGMTAQDLARRLGPPALQVREGASLKLQFRSAFCVLDAYLYPPVGASAPYRVTHVDARTRSLAPVNQATCLASLQGA
jgi:hypothetical protein